MPFSTRRRTLTSPEAVRNAVMRLLSRREYSRQQLENKLSPTVAEQSWLTKVLDEMQRARIQDDARLADILVRQSIEARYGPHKIRVRLQHAGITVENISLKQDQDFWINLAEAAIERRFPHSSTFYQANDRARMERFLCRRGFDAATIHAALKRFCKI